MTTPFAEAAARLRDIIDNCHEAWHADGFIADIRTLLAEREEMESHIHFCPKCKMYCKECQCMEAELAQLKAEREKLVSILDTPRCYCGKDGCLVNNARKYELMAGVIRQIPHDSTETIKEER